MRIAALCDIHGNLPALDAALAAVREAGADSIVICGDLIPGPMPRLVLERVLALVPPPRILRGNSDREVLSLLQGADPETIPERIREVVAWTARQLDSGLGAAIAGWPETIRLEVDGLGQVLFCHATPHNDVDVFTKHTPEAALRPVFDGILADLVVCGHTHMPFDRRIGATRVVNPGSVGMPFGATGAHWVLLGPDVRLERTLYDLDAAALAVRATEYPQAESFAARNVLAPPTEAEVLAMLAPMELKVPA